MALYYTVPIQWYTNTINTVYYKPRTNNTPTNTQTKRNTKEPKTTKMEVSMSCRNRKLRKQTHYKYKY